MVWSKPNVSDLVAKRDTKRVTVVADVEMEAEIELYGYKPRIAGSCQKLGEKHGTGSPSETPEETTLQHLDFELLAS